MINQSILSIERSLATDVGSISITGTVSGVPIGGAAGQILAKQSNNNYDAYWIDQTVVDTSNLYPRSNPSGYISGDLSLLYPRSNPSGYISGDLSLLYPRNNPSGYITGIDTSNFYTKDNPSGYITGDLSLLYPRSNPSGYISGIQNLVYTTGDQSISGNKIFADGISVEDGTSNVYTLFVSGQNVGINNENPQVALDVSGSARFSERPFVNGTGVVLIGEINTSNFYTNDNPSGFITGVFQPNPDYSLPEDQSNALDQNGDSFEKNSPTSYLKEFYGLIFDNSIQKWVLNFDDNEGQFDQVAIATTTGGTYPWSVSYTNGWSFTRYQGPRLKGSSLASNALEGVSIYAARADHVHPYPSALNIGAAPIVGNKVPSQYLPSYVDDVLEYSSLQTLQADTVNGRESGKIYVALDSGKIYRWSGSLHVEISNSLELQDINLPDSQASVIVLSFILPIAGVQNNRSEYSDTNFIVSYTGTRWQLTEGNNTSEPGQYVAAIGNELYPWLADWSSSGYAPVLKNGTYDPLKPEPLGNESSSGTSIKAAREDHVHIFPTASEVNALGLTSSSYVIAKPGDNLAAKYTAAKALTPNGSAKSATNRASLIIFPGNYTLSAELAIDEEFVDLIGLGAQTQKPAILIGGNTLNVSASNVKIVGIGVLGGDGEGFKVSVGSTSQIFENCTTATNGNDFGGNGVYTNCYAIQTAFNGNGTYNNCSDGGNSFNGNGTYIDCSSGNESFNGVGTYNNCSAGTESFNGNGASYSNCTGSTNCFGTTLVEGIYKNCTAGDFSFGASTLPVTITGTFENCTAGIGCFGNSPDVVTINGATFKNCHGGLGCFGNSDANVDITSNSSFENCTAGNSSFGSSNSSTASIVGTFLSCSAGNNSFGCGYTASIQNSIFKNCIAVNNNFGWGEGVSITNSTFDNCRAVDESFVKCFSGGGSVDSSSLFNSCTAGNRSFGNSPAALTVAGTFKNCKGGSNCFGVDMEFVAITGKIINCEANSFPSVVYDSGLIFNCIDGNGDIINAEA